MASRGMLFAKHARTLTARLSKSHNCSIKSLPFRSFSHARILSTPASSEKPYPVDSLVADVIELNQQLEANPPKKRGPKPKPVTIKLADAIGSTELPPLDQWSDYFPWSIDTKARSSLMNPATAKALAEAYVPEGATDQIIVEAFPGPGVLTRALLELPKERIKRLIVLEDYDRFYKFIKPLETLDSRITVIPLSGFSWGTYDHLSDLGLLDDVQVMNWTRAHTHLKFISHIPVQVHGEQLVSQFFRSIPERQWLFKYGRVPVHLIMTQSLWDRVSAPLYSQVRCKLSVIAEATASFKLTVPPEILAPYPDNFYPPSLRSHGVQDLVAVSAYPLSNQVIEQGTIDEWDYVLRRLFVQRATPLTTTLPQLAPGAKTILKKITDSSLAPSARIDPKKPSRGLSAKEWKIIADAFIDWPFKPEDLSIDSFNYAAEKLKF